MEKCDGNVMETSRSFYLGIKPQIETKRNCDTMKINTPYQVSIPLSHSRSLESAAPKFSDLPVLYIPPPPPHGSSAEKTNKMAVTKYLRRRSKVMRDFG